MERWLAAASRYMADVEVPLLVRSLQRRGMTRGELAELLAEEGARPLTVGRVDQIAAPARRIEDGTSETLPPSWWTGQLSDAPPEHYHPLADVAKVAPPPLPLT